MKCISVLLALIIITLLALPADAQEPDNHTIYLPIIVKPHIEPVPSYEIVNAYGYSCSMATAICTVIGIKNTSNFAWHFPECDGPHDFGSQYYAHFTVYYEVGGKRKSMDFGQSYDTGCSREPVQIGGILASGSSFFIVFTDIWESPEESRRVVFRGIDFSPIDYCQGCY